MKFPLAGRRLREIREKLRLTLKDVETHSREIAEARQSFEYLFTAGRLSQVENSSSLPSLYKLASLSEIYRVPYAELLRIYGIETDRYARSDASPAAPNQSGQEYSLAT